MQKPGVNVKPRLLRLLISIVIGCGASGAFIIAWSMTGAGIHDPLIIACAFIGGACTASLGGLTIRKIRKKCEGQDGPARFHKFQQLCGVNGVNKDGKLFPSENEFRDKNKHISTDWWRRIFVNHVGVPSAIFRLVIWAIVAISVGYGTNCGVTQAMSLGGVVSFAILILQIIWAKYNMVPLHLLTPVPLHVLTPKAESLVGGAAVPPATSPSNQEVASLPLEISLTTEKWISRVENEIWISRGAPSPQPGSDAGKRRRLHQRNRMQRLHRLEIQFGEPKACTH